MPPFSAFDWLVLFGWMSVSYVAISYLAGMHDWAYKTGKYAVVFMIGAAIGMAIV